MTEKNCLGLDGKDPQVINVRREGVSNPRNGCSAVL